MSALLLLILLSSSFQEKLNSSHVTSSFPNPIPCGYDDPKEPDDCILYGIDSDMVCCYFKKYTTDVAQCVMISNTLAESSGVDGEKDFGDEYWNCGNDAGYLRVNGFIVAALIFFIIYGLL